jgi:hypothetical protein
MRLDVWQFGVFDGDCSAMAIKSPEPMPLPMSTKYGWITQSVQNYLQWVHSQMPDTTPHFTKWLGSELRQLLKING